MKKRCSLSHPLLFPALMAIFLVAGYLPAFSQCQGEFDYKAIPGEASPEGSIEISVKNPEPGTYTFKVYSISGEITLVQTKEAASPERIILKGLAPDTYLVRIAWADNCYTVIGGLEGIRITVKSPHR